MRPQYGKAVLAALVAVVLGVCATAALFVLFRRFQFGPVTLPFLMVNPIDLAVVAVYQLIWHRTLDVRHWYYKAPAACLGVSLVVLLFAVILPDTGERDDIQVLICVVGKPVFFWLAMCVGDEDMPPLVAAGAASFIGVLHVIAGVSMLVLRGVPIWVWDSPFQIGWNMVILTFFDPLYIAVPLVLYYLGLYSPVQADEVGDFPDFPVAAP